ncbi:unnamed protein product, partial [Polarella glacialis]
CAQVPQPRVHTTSFVALKQTSFNSMGGRNNRQQYCVAAGGVLVMAVGFMLLAAWRLVLDSEVLRVFEARLCLSLLVSGSLAVGLGVIGAGSACCQSRLVLCGYSWAALFLGISCATCSALLSLQVASRATRVEMDCQEVQLGSPVGSAARPANEAYEGMYRDLAYCRKASPLALRLDACLDSPGSPGDRWRSSPFEAMLRSAEEEYRCSGFCEDGQPLFALPVGTINQENKLKKRPACFSPLMEEVREMGVFGCLALLLAALLLVLPSCCACWLACAPPPVRRPNYAHRPEELLRSAPEDDLDEENGESERLLQ